MKALVLATGLGFAAGFFASGCGSATPTCTAATCQGCCDPGGVCKSGDEGAACGTGGVACNVCSGGQVCTLKSCVLPPQIDAGSDAGDSDAGVDAGTPLCGSTPVACSDTAVLQLDLKMTVNPSAITNAPEDGGFKTTIDSTAGGSPPTQSFVYAKFTPTGLEKVAISDEAALASLDWDIAFRRFVIRLNSGPSGPSCDVAFAEPAGVTYDQVTTPPATGSTFISDDFLGAAPTCTFKDDGSGLTSSPSTAFANPSVSFYAYTACVSMTNRVFVVRTRFGHDVKVVVTTYYATEAAQATCNSGTMPNVAGGTVRIRWSFLD